MADTTREERARARASWPVRRHDLEAAPGDVLHGVSPEACVAMVWALTLDAWASGGLPIPDYPRASAPGRVVRRGTS